MPTRGNEPVLGALFAAAVVNTVLLIALLGVPTGWSGPRGVGYVAAAIGFAAVFGVLVLVRHRAPRVVLAMAVLTVCAYYIVGLPSIGAVLPLLIFLAAATAAGHRWFALVAALLLYGVSAFFRGREGEAIENLLGFELLTNLALAVLTIALAEVVRTRRQLQESQGRVVRLAADAARAESERAQLAERSRIARELHDDVGHSLAIISLHANASAELLSPDHPAAATLGHARTAASQALHQLRKAVRALGTGSSRDLSGPQLADVDLVADRLRAGGITVDVRQEHDAVPAAVEAAAFRIVQEATTNALRHSQARRIQITITSAEATDEDPAALRVDVRNDGVRVNSVDGVPSSATTGRGLAGLHARAAELGGEVSWSFLSPDQFVVRAMLPVPGRDR